MRQDYCAPLIAATEHDGLAATSTLADPSVVANLVAERMNRWIREPWWPGP